ncbi:Alkaline phosphatase synthesis sensor protein PhoR [compost metagenome]
MGPVRPSPIRMRAWATTSVVTVVMAVLTGGAVWALVHETDRRLSEAAWSDVGHIKARSDQFVARRVLALKAAQGLFESSEKVTEAEFVRFGTQVTRGFQGLRSLNYVDPGLTIRWVAPMAGNERAQGLSLVGLEGEAPVRRAIATGQPSATDVINLREGGRGVLFFLPVRQGAVQTVADLTAFLNAMRFDQDSETYFVRLTDGAGQPLYDAWGHGGPVVTAPLVVADRRWQLEVSARRHWLDYAAAWLTAAIGLGLWLGMLALIWSGALRSARLSRLVAAQTEELRTSRDQLKVILDGIADGVVVVAPPDGRVVYLNEAANALLGLPRPVTSSPDSLEARAGRLHMADEHGEPVPYDRLPAWRALQGEAVRGAVLRYEHLATGEPRVMVVTANPILDEAGQVRFAVTILHDLTERVALEGRLKAQLDELQTLDRLKTDFLNVVTHELRTPLTSIRGFAEFLEDGIGGQLSDDQQDFVRHIQGNAEQLGALVDDLLDLARLEAGRFTLRCQAIELVALAREVADGMRPQALAAGLTLALEAPPPPLALYADPVRLRQVLGNLLANAVKFTPAGGTVTIAVREEGELLAVRVQDSGIGIAEEHMPRLFSKFFQVESALNRTFKGTGLGLPITRGLVEAHGGRIDVTSRLGEGTTVTVWLPRGAAPSPDVGPNA